MAISTTSLDLPLKKATHNPTFIDYQSVQNCKTHDDEDLSSAVLPASDNGDESSDTDDDAYLLNNPQNDSHDRPFLSTRQSKPSSELEIAPTYSQMVEYS